MSKPSVLAVATGSASTSATDPITPLLVPHFSSSSVGSAVPEDGEEEVLAGLVDQIPPSSMIKSEEILNHLKTGNEWMQKTLELIDSTLSAYAPDMKMSWNLMMETYVKEIDPFLWRCFKDQSYQMITQCIDQYAAIKQTPGGGGGGQSQQQYILSYHPTAGTLSVTQLPYKRVTCNFLCWVFYSCSYYCWFNCKC